MNWTQLCTKESKAIPTLHDLIWFELDGRFLKKIHPAKYYILSLGVTAALELSLVSKDLSNMEKLEFVKRKVEFMQEFGDVGR